MGAGTLARFLNVRGATEDAMGVSDRDEGADVCGPGVGAGRGFVKDVCLAIPTALGSTADEGMLFLVLG